MKSAFACALLVFICAADQDYPDGFVFDHSNDEWVRDTDYIVVLNPVIPAPVMPVESLPHEGHGASHYAKVDPSTTADSEVTDATLSSETTPDEQTSTTDPSSETETTAETTGEVADSTSEETATPDAIECSVDMGQQAYIDCMIQAANF